MGRGFKEVTADFDVLSKSVASATKLDLGNKRVIKLKHKHPGNAASLEASIPGLSVNFDMKTKDVVLEHKRTVGWGDLTLKQRVPHKQLYLVPSPDIKLAFKPAYFFKSKLRSETTLGYDYLTSTGRWEQSLTHNSRYKATLSGNTQTGRKGAALELQAKLNKRHITSVGVDLSCAKGPVFKTEGTMYTGVHATKVKLDYRVRSKEAKIELQPPAYNKVKLTLTSVVKTDKPAARPSLLLGAKMDL